MINVELLVNIVHDLYQDMDRQEIETLVKLYVNEQGTFDEAKELLIDKIESGKHLKFAKYTNKHTRKRKQILDFYE